MPHKYTFLNDHEILESLQARKGVPSSLLLGIDIGAGYGSLCGLGNIRAAGTRTVGTSLIERALSFQFPVHARGKATILGMRPDRHSLSAMALFALRDAGNGREINESLVIWVGAFDRLGLEGACREHSKLAGRYTDSNVIQALEVIAGNPEWPTPKAKIRQMMALFKGTFSKVNARQIAAIH